MAKMDWDRVSREKRIQLHGSAGVDEEHTGGDGPLGSRLDEPYWPPADGAKPGDLYRSQTARSNVDGEHHDPSMVVFFNLFVSQSKDNANLEQCSDGELRECRATCQLILNTLSGLTWSSEQDHNSSPSIVTKAIGGQRATKDSVLTIALRTIDLLSKDKEELNACTNMEIQSFREICQSTRNRVNLQILQRNGGERSSS